MPNASAAVMKVAAKAWPLIVKNWPKVMLAVGAITKFVNANPDLPKKVRDLLTGVPQRVVDAQQRGTESARIRATLDIVRDVAREAAGADRPTLDADSYVKRADGIEHGVRLAEALGRAAKKQTLTRLRTQTDGLLAELIEVVAGTADGGLTEPEAARAE